jgi:hypothetical protein
MKSTIQRQFESPSKYNGEESLRKKISKHRTEASIEVNTMSTNKVDHMVKAMEDIVTSQATLSVTLLKVNMWEGNTLLFQLRK